MNMLPKSREIRSLDNLQIGEESWNVPWALLFDLEGQAFLDTSHQVEQSQGGTGKVRVTRTASGYDIDCSHIDNDAKWEKKILPLDKARLVPIDNIKWPMS